MTFAAGLAMQGMRPIVCIYSTFLQRAFDQVMCDVALHKLPVTFVLDRAGITGDDGFVAPRHARPRVPAPDPGHDRERTELA